MNGQNANIILWVACAAGLASLLYSLYLLNRLRARDRDIKEVTQRSAQVVADLKNRISELETAIRRKIINAKTDSELLRYFDDMLKRHADSIGNNNNDRANPDG